MNKAFLCIVAIFTFCMLSAQNGSAAMYKYVDKNGTLCFANDLQSVPEQCRAAAVVVSDETQEERKPSSDQPVAASAEVIPPPASAPAAKPGAPFSARLLISVCVMLLSGLAFWGLSRLTPLKKNTKMLPMVRVLLVAVVSLYLVYAHARDVLGVFGLVGRGVEEVEQRSAEKGKKAAQAIQKIDAFMQDAQQAALPEPAGKE